MNHVYRVIWNEVLGTWQAVAEVARGRGKTKSQSGKAAESGAEATKAKGSSVLAFSAVALGIAAVLGGTADWAQATLPTGGTVVAGTGSISQSGSVLTVSQGSAKMAADWQSFNIGQGNTVNFVQPSSSAVALNRVLGNDVSVIQGALNANGQVFLVNPNGVLFTPTAQVNVGSLVASTLNISTADFMAGRYKFDSVSRSTGEGQAVINHAKINATGDNGLGGSIALIAARVINTGTLSAPGGNVLLGAGSKVTLDLGGPVKLQVEQGALDALISNGGAIRVDGGLVYMSAKAAGDLTASVINHSGVVDASSLTAKGGRIVLEGDAITLTNGSTLNTTGATGGGEVLVGGGWQGSGDMHQATTVTMAQGAKIDVSATQKGDGGTAVLWSDVRKADSVTNAHGNLLAKGGVNGGNGGRIETSASIVAIDGFQVDTLAPKGEAGLWLIDPYDYNINSGEASTISTALNSGSVTITTASNTGGYGGNGNNSSNGDINVNNSITKTSGGPTTLTLEAARHIRLGTGATITSNSGALNVSLQADTDNNGDGIVFIEGAGISTNGGSLTFGGSGRTVNIGGTAVRVGGDVFFQRGSAQSLSTSGGAINIWGETIVSNTSGLTVNSGGGNVGFNGLLNSGNAYVFESNGNNWNTARSAARNNTGGGSAINDSYLVTITSRLENSIAGLAANYQGAWIGNWRADTSNYAWSWADGPEAGQVFFNQNAGAGGGGTATVGSYANFAAPEPNGNLSGSESVGQFFGTAGQWNDLPVVNVSTGIYATVGYVRETNLDGSPVTINAGAGAVTFNGSVGGAKALASLNVVSGTTAVNGTALITTGTQTYNNALTVTSTGDLQVSATSLSVTNASQSATFKATGNITQKSGMAVTTNGGNVIYWADSDSSGTSSTAGGSISIDGGFITTGGGKLVMAGGLDGGDNGGTASDGVPDGFAIGAASSQWGITVTGTTLNAGAGDILLRGFSTGTGGGTNIGVRMYSNPAMTVTSGNFTAVGFGSIKDTTGSSTNNWGVGMEGVNLTASGNVSITGTGGASTTGGGNHGVLLGGMGGTIATTAIDKTITFTGASGSGSTGDNDGVAINAGYTLGSANTGAISITGTTTSNTVSSEGISVRGNLRSGASGTAINVNGTSAGSTLANNGVLIDSTGLHATGSGGISVTGTAGRAAVTGVAATNSNILAASGPIVLNGGVYGIAASGSTLGKEASTSVTTSSSNVTFTGNVVSFSGATTVDTTGKLAVQPFGASFTSALSWPLTNLTLGSGVSGLTLGKDGNTANITIASATTVPGPIAIYGGNIAVNAGLTATGVSSAIALKASGTVTQSAALSADTLALLGGTTVTLTNASNAIGTLAASGVGNLSYVDSNALTIGTVGSTDGIASTGTVSVSTLTGNLTLSKNVGTTNTTVNALVLNAESSAAAGTATGGNLMLTGSPSVTVGTGGTAKLYSGSVAGSTGLLGTGALISGSGRFRYYSDETTTNFNNSGATALGTGLYAIYRERPSASIAVGSQTITYGDALTLAGTTTGLVNGDTGSYVIANALYSTSNNLLASGTPYALSNDAAAFGYNVTAYTPGTLTVNAKALTLNGFAANTTKVYDGATTAIISNAGNLSGLVGSDVVTVTNTGATYDTKTVGTGKTVTLNGVSLTSTDAGNYSIANTAAATADITTKALTISGITAAAKTYDGNTTAVVSTTGASYGGLVGGDSLAVAATGVFNNKYAATGKTVTLSSSYSGFDVGNYSITDQASTTANITPKALSVTASAVSKTYDGTTNAVGTATVGMLATGDNVNAAAVLAFTDKNVGTANKTVRASGLTIKDAGNADMTSNYTLTYVDNTASTISPAALTVHANNDSKFVTQADRAGYNDVSYSGLVNGEIAGAGGTAGITGTVAIIRIGGATAAGSYSGVLKASGLSASNYTITYANGDYTIVPANQLLVKVTNVTNTYGTATTYAVSEAKYLATDGSTIVDLLSGVSAAGNTITIADGSSGNATFTIALSAGSTGGAGLLNVGNYALAATAITETSANFSNNLVLIGNHSVAQKGLTATATGVSKVYDGNTSMTGVSLGLTGREVGDVVTVNGSGAFASKNVGSANLAYTISNLALGGGDGNNYYLPGGATLAGTNGTITQKTLTVSGIAASNKVYDGNTTAAVVTAGTSYNGLVVGDSVAVAATGVFGDKNVATGKTVTVTSTYSGADVGNYAIIDQASTTADISRLNTVAWIGPSTGNWFDPANWAGGAVPDLSNVANVVIPIGVTVTFGTAVVAPAQGGAVNVDGIGNAGSLSVTGGTLNVGNGGMQVADLNQSGGSVTSIGAVVADNFNQTGGSFGTANNFTVKQSFSQGSSGSVTVVGNASITDTSGGLVLGNLSTGGNLSVTSQGGAITQANGTAIQTTGTTALDASSGPDRYDITLNSATNDFGGAVNVTGANVSVTDANALTLGAVNTTGDLTVNSTSALDLGTSTVGGNLSANSGNGNISQTGALTVNGISTLNAGAGNIALANPANDFVGAVNASGNSVALVDVNALTLGTVIASSDLTVSSTGALDLGTSTVGGNLNANSGNGNITQTGALAIAGASQLGQAWAASR